DREAGEAHRVERWCDRRLHGVGGERLVDLPYGQPGDRRERERVTPRRALGRVVAGVGGLLLAVGPVAHFSARSRRRRSSAAWRRAWAVTVTPPSMRASSSTRSASERRSADERVRPRLGRLRTT